MNEQVMKTKKQTAGILVLILLMGITFFFYLKGYSFYDLWMALKDANFAYLFASLCMMLLFISCEALNISMITKVLGTKVPFGRCFGYSCIGFYFSSITPSASGGQPAQIFYMKKDKIPLTVSSITIFYIVYVYQIAMILFGCILAVWRSNAATMFVLKLKYLFLFGMIVNSMMVFILFLVMFSKKLVPSVTSFIIIKLERLPFFKKALVLQEKMENAINTYHEKTVLLKEHPVLFLKVLLVTIIQMAALNIVPALVYLAMNYPANRTLDLLTCQSLLTISVSAIPLPGAEGISQSGFLRVFDMFFKPDTIISAMLIQRTLSFYIPLVFSFAVYFLTQIRSIRKVRWGDVTNGK